MSYQKMMKWNSRHRKGTKQPCIMHTESGFTPSISFLDKYHAYRERAILMGITPIECEAFYRLPNFERAELLNNH